MQAQYSTRLTDFTYTGCYNSSEQHTIQNSAVYLMSVFCVNKLFDIVRFLKGIGGLMHALQRT
jgi:hypothetical protein